MSKVRDRTEDFRDAVRRAAINLGYNESKIAVLMAHFIMQKSPERSSFTNAALVTLQSIRTLEQFLMEHEKDYIDLHRTTQQERDIIEHEVMVFIKACKDEIDVIQNSINEDGACPTGWLGTRSEDMNTDTIAHKHGAVLILSDKLHSVTSRFDHLRALLFQDAVDRVASRRKLKPNNVTDSSTTGNIEHRERDTSEVIQPDAFQAEQVKLHSVQVFDETYALQVELTNMLDAVRGTETKMVEMSALNHLMSTHVLHQAQQIEHLYEQAVEATYNVELGNKELSQAIQRNSSGRTFLLLFLIVLTLSVLFLDWYN